jgi:hypothetical protein
VNARIEPRARLVLAVLVTLAAAPGSAQEKGDRFYLGAGLEIADHSAREEGIAYDDSPLGTTLYGGVQLRDRLAVEAAWQAFPSVSSGAILGSGVSRLAIDSDLDVVVIRAVFRLELGEEFARAARWTVFATAGAFSLDDRRRVSDLIFGTAAETKDASSGVALGAGVLYDLRHLRLRATAEQRDGGDTEQTSLGVTAEFRF